MAAFVSRDPQGRKAKRLGITQIGTKELRIKSSPPHFPEFLISKFNAPNWRSTSPGGLWILQMDTP
jgi:hypothetical protein